MGESVDIRLLGRFSVRREGEEIPPGAFGGRLVRTLLRLLLTRRGEFVSHDVLAEALWPGRMPANPAANLKVLVNRGRTALGDPSLIATGPGGYSFAAGDACRVDAEEFLAAVAAGGRHLRDGQAAAALRLLRAALDSWGGEPLAEDAYENWASDYRAALWRGHLQALEEGAAAALALRDAGQAVVLAEAAVAREPLREAASLVLAEALAASGDSVAALRIIDGLRHRLGEEAGLEPSDAILDLERRIQRGERAGPPSRRPCGVAAGVVFEGLRFVGRDEQLAVVLAVTQGSSPGVALVQGSAGAGKSRLLEEVADRSALPVISARAFLPEREEPWGLARSLLREALALDLEAAAALPERAAVALADVLPELEEVRSLGSVSIDRESRRALALEAAVRLVGTVAAKGALIVADDLQWSDATSVHLLGLIARRVPSAALVLAYRPEEVSSQGAVAPWLGDLVASRDLVVEVPIGPLSLPTLTELVADPAVADAIARDTDGTPLAVAEVVRRLAADGVIEPDGHGRWRTRSEDAARRAGEIGRAGQRQGIERRAGRQPPDRREMLSLLALLGREAPARVLAAATGADQPAVLDDLDALARTGLVRLGEGGWATAHDLIGETVADTLRREERGRLHQLLAHALLGEGGDPAEVARHLAEAGDRPAAASAFADAACQRLERFASDEARTLADAGLGTDPSRTVRVSLLETRAEARERLGDQSGARSDLLEALAAHQAPLDRARVLSKLALLTCGQDAAEAIALAESALVEAGTDARSRAEALVAAAFAEGNSDQLDRVQSRVVEARGLFDQLGDARGLASTVDAQANFLFFKGELVEAAALYQRAVRLYRDSGQLTKVGTPLTMRAWCLSRLGRHDEADADWNESVELERSLGQAEGEAACLVIGADVALARGHWDEARERLATGMPVGRSVGTGELIAWGLIVSGCLSEVAGDLETAEVAFREAIEAAGDLRFQSSVAASCLASTLLAGGDLAGAQTFATRALAPGVGPGPWRAGLVLAEIAVLREEPGAETQAREALRRASHADPFVSSARVRLEQLLGATSDPVVEVSVRQRKVFVFTDIVGSSNLVDVLGDEAWDHLLRWHDQTLRHLFAAHAGEEVNRIGDGFFVVFDQPVAAVHCAVAIQRALADHRRDHGFAPAVRIGIHRAEATRQGDDYQGKGVHEASRIGGLADGGEIVASQASLADLEGIRCSEPRAASLKGFSQPVEVVWVEWR